MGALRLTTVDIVLST